MTKPLNQRIKDFIQSEIDQGTWDVGDRIPSEAELSRKFNASRMTVNRAVKELTERGRLRRVQGLGTYVAPFVARAPLFEVQSIRDEIENRGEIHRCTVLLLAHVELSHEHALRLGVMPGVDTYYLEALHTADGRPLQLEKRYVNSAIAPAFIDQDFTQITASEYLLKHVPYTEVEHTVDAIASDQAMGTHLKLEPGAPCLRLTRRTLAQEAVITRVELIHPGDQFKLTGTFPSLASLSQVA